MGWEFGARMGWIGGFEPKEGVLGGWRACFGKMGVWLDFWARRVIGKEAEYTYQKLGH